MANSPVVTEIKTIMTGLMYELPQSVRQGSFLDAWHKEQDLQNLGKTYNAAIEVSGSDKTEIDMIREDIDWGFEKGCLLRVDSGKTTLEEASRIAKEKEHDEVNVKEKVQRMMKGYVAAQISTGAVSGGVGLLLEDVSKALNIPADSQIEFLSAIRATGRYSDVGRPQSDPISEMLAAKGYSWNNETKKYERKQV